MVPLNFYIGWRERIGIAWRAVKWVSVGRFAGTFLGLWILLVVNLHQLVLVIGWSTLIAAVAALLAPASNPNRSALGVAGLVTGGYRDRHRGWRPASSARAATSAGRRAALDRRCVFPHRGSYFLNRPRRVRATFGRRHGVDCGMVAVPLGRGHRDLCTTDSMGHCCVTSCSGSRFSRGSSSLSKPEVHGALLGEDVKAEERSRPASDFLDALHRVSIALGPQGHFHGGEPVAAEDL